MATSEAPRRPEPAARTATELRPIEESDDRSQATGLMVAPEAEPEAATPDRRVAPERPSLGDKAAPPVLVKLPPPFFVRASQILWFLSLVTGGVAIVYMFVIRQTQLPLIADTVRAVDATRAEATYTAAADIIFWSTFGLSVAVVLMQIVFQVSFSNRRQHARWWQFGSVLFQGGLVLIVRQMVALGEQGVVLERLMLIQLGLALLGLLCGLLPQALRWTARQYDVRRGPVTPAGDTQL